MNFTRRKFLQSLFIGFAITTKKGWANKLPTPAIERRDLFPQGVASGDPTADSVILWTRRPPVKDSFTKKLIVEISTTSDFKKILAGGTANISAESDWTCRFLVTDLKPNREYWYRFVDDHGFASRIGRTINHPDFKKILAGGTANISAESDWTCRFLVTDLKPNREYWYRFVDEHGFASRIRSHHDGTQR